MQSDITLPLEEMTKMVKLAVELGQIPRYLYKYKSNNDKLDSILTNSQLWFSQPSEFNDPFDCQYTTNTDNTIQEIEEFLRRAGEGAIPEAQVKMLARNVFNKPLDLNKLVNNVISRNLNSMRVCCFCSDEEGKQGSGKENMLLWAHYTDSHKGVCLVFDVLADPGFFVTPLRVIYQDNYPEYNHLRDYKYLADRLIKPKSSHWKYENEIRVIKQKDGLHKFANKALIEIAFGVKCHPGEVERLSLLAKDSGFSNIKFTKAEVLSNKYGLKFSEI